MCVHNDLKPRHIMSIGTMASVHWKTKFGDDDDTHTWLQTTQPTSGGAVTTDTNCCANCVKTSRPQQWAS